MTRAKLQQLLFKRPTLYALLLIVFAFNLSSHTFAFWPGDNWWLRSIYWLTYLILGLVFITGTYLLIKQLFPTVKSHPAFWLAIVLSWLPFGLTISMVDIATSRPFTSLHMGEWEKTGFLSSLIPALAANILPRHLAFGALLYFIHFYVQVGPRSNNQTEITEATATIEAAFLKKISGDVKGELQLLQAQEHYLKVTTDHGEDLILYKFGQAIDELPEDYGIQLHRSFWAAKHNIVGWSSTDNGIKAILQYGTEAPVSRRFEQQIKPHFPEIS